MHRSLPVFSHPPLCLFSPRLPLLVNRGITVTPDRGKQVNTATNTRLSTFNLLLHNHSQHNMHQTDDDLSPSIGAPPAWNSLNSTPVPAALVRVRERRQHQLLLPPPSMRAAPVDTRYSASTDDPAAELANRVRKNAGVVLAMQIGSDPQFHPPASTAPPAPSYPTPNTAASAFTTAPVAPSAPPTPATPVQTATQSRPKTSHTTIERRYRTNVNARIQLLHQAVPALRVVDRAAAIKAGELYRDGDASDPENHINARGFIDGVKIMCKCSKAVEYIRVLKNREKRLTCELEGLKTLLRGLVGGTELLGEWEREWVGMFGVGERDEVVPLPASATASASANSSHAGSPALALSTSVPMHSSTAAYAQRQQEIMQQHQQPRQQDLTSAPRQYLLGAFALFSLFANANVSSPAPSSSSYSHQPTHAHEGHVITPVSIAGKVYGHGLEGDMGLLQASHFLASAAVLTKVEEGEGSEPEAETDGERSAGSRGSLSEDVDTDVWEEEGMQYRRRRTATRRRVFWTHAPAHRILAIHVRFPFHNHHLPSSTSTTTTSRPSARARSSTKTDNRRRLLALLVRPVPLLGARVTPRLWAGVDEAAGRLGAMKRTRTRRGGISVLRTLEAGAAVERLRAVGGRAFVREVLGASFTSTPTFTSAPTSTASTSTSTSTASTSSASTSTSTSSTPNEDADASTGILAKAAASEREVARVREREREEARAALEVAARLGGRIARLGARVGCILEGSSSLSPDDDAPDWDADAEFGDGEENWEQEGEDGEQEGAEANVEKLLRAIVLYRHVFGSPSASSPASPASSASASANTKGASASRTSAAARALRRTLGSSEVFEDAGAGVEEARNRVVDLLTGEV
ncbi:hypothetical protein B0H16DRAFT_1797541 [Mycena metata]|uniref:BHLH domain-containing protein n=1 Tax=Mycena metata TaxID=1033252 RepID=A0AAD7HF10_9AGAR|nr:hypothetical protein B0H16DRAFT_1797541 [Mycena metata]